MSEPLIDPSLLKNLTEVEKDEALAAAAAAKRAEERAEQRMLERAMERKRLEREKERALELEHQRTRMNEVSGLARMNHAISSSSGVNGIEHRSGSLDDNDGGSNGNSSNKVVFISKKRRAEMKEKGNPDGNDDGNGNASHKKIKSHSGASVSASLSASRNASARSSRNDRMSDSRGASNRSSSSSSSSSSSNRISNNRSNSRQQKQHQLTTSELNAIKKTYLGESALQDEETLQRKHKEERQRAKQKKKTMFKFEWDASEDTSMDADGISMPTMMSTIRNKSRNNGSGRDERRGGRHGDSRSRTGNRDRDRDERGSSVMTKPIAKMTKRDWRIFRENYDITVRGGKAPPPLRNFRESSTSEVPAIHPVIINAIENVLRYREPSPIQRQAIPIGLQRRDLIGVAETGSGKTAAFGIPLIQLIFSLPQKALDTVAENGPLALVMAPTRELAIQIDAEFQRILSRQKNIKTACIVGGQPIQKQAMELRGGVHVIVGTPGRLNDCLEEAYLVLNQCSYIVLDEADRMIDLGFAPQIESILDAMGGLLKSENEKEAYDQELKDLRQISEHVPTHRLTAMFSATMPAEVQRIARKYLRHPAVVSIGGPGGGGKNKRIDQRVLFLSSPGMKEKALREVLQKTRNSDKIIVFVNEKKHTEGVSRSIERMGRRTVVLHGGKSQDQREENLAMFKRGEVILVATDVAGRGLDIPNVKHVINYDVPSRSIDSYCHRIGRTARAGATGIATSFITDQDEGIMAPLKNLLESMGAPVPDRLARHPAAASAGGRSIIH